MYWTCGLYNIYFSSHNEQTNVQNTGTTEQADQQMLATIQKTNDPMTMQMLQQMATMQSQLANLTLSATNTP